MQFGQTGPVMTKPQLLLAIREHWLGLRGASRASDEDTIEHHGHSISLRTAELDRGWSCVIVEDGFRELFQVEVFGERSLEKLESLLDCYLAGDCQ